MNKTELILASASPRRLALLQQLGWQPQVHVTDIDESVLPGEAADVYCTRMAIEKAAAAIESMGIAVPVLAADTTVVLDGRCLGKPSSSGEAVETLMQLSDRAHRVYSAVAVTSAGETESILSESVVHFGSVSVTEAEHYVASGEPMDKAGSYGIQGMAAKWIKRIEGSYSSIVGLPLYETTQLFRKLNIMVP